MLHRNIANRYAHALFNLAKENGQLEAVEKDFPRVALLLQDNEELREFITHPAIISSEKKKVVGTIFKGKIVELLYDFISMAIDKHREAYIPLMWEGFRDLLLIHRNRQEAEVETPFELPAELQSALAAKLEKLTGKNIVIKQTIEPKLIGGIRVRLGDRVVDGSIVQRLRQMRVTLQSAKV